MTSGREWLAWSASKDQAIESACRRRILSSGYTITSERPGWITAQKGEWKLGANTIVELCDWIALAIKKRRHQ